MYRCYTLIKPFILSFNYYKKVKKIAILQSNYIPWKGVFDMINMVDEFVFLEDVDYSKQTWRNRNRIPTPNGEIWLTVPIKKVKLGTKIKDVLICNNTNWQQKHYLTIERVYKKSPYFKYYKHFLDDIYLNNNWDSLSNLNIYITKKISEIIGIEKSFVNSTDLNTRGTKDDKVIEICKKLGATHYLSGPAAKDYINNEKFKKNHIGLSYINYNYYPEYKQLYGNFNHYVSVLDVLFNCGSHAADYIFQGKEDIIIP